MEQNEQLEELELLKQRLAQERPAEWDDLPDIPLYMDQVVAYLGRQLINFDGDVLTSAMINNYIKDGLVPRANGKKYEKDHLTRLSMVAAVKQVLSVRDIGVLLETTDRLEDPRQLYADFRRLLDQALNATLDHIAQVPDQEDLPALAFTLALRSYADALACRRVVELLRPEDEKAKKKKEKEAKKK